MDAEVIPPFWYSTILTAAIGICGLCMFLYYRRTPYNLPPGPRGWPILGVLPNIVTTLRNGLHGHDFMTKFSLQYGPVFSCNLVGKRLVILNDFQSISECFSNPCVDDRTTSITEVCQLLNRPEKPLPYPGGKGIGLIFGSGIPWRENRKFFLRHFRNFSKRETNFDTLIATEAQFLADAVAKQGHGIPFNPNQVLSNATANVISAVVLGKRFNYEDNEFVDLLKSYEAKTKLLGAGGLILIIPKAIASILMRKQLEDLYDIIVNDQLRFGKIVDAHIAKGADPENSHDAIDAYLVEMSSKDEAYLKASLLSIINDMYGAGMETSSNTLLWGLRYMTEYPDIQRRLQRDIDQVIDKDRLPTESDRLHLPYVETTILEILRIQCVVPVSARVASCDTTIGKYDIPKGTIIFGNLWKVHHDPKLWQEPDKFKPERFIDANGKVSVPQHMIPFSTGRRFCLGKKIANAEIFIFFTHLLHKFVFKIPDGQPRASFDGISGLTYAPKPFKICALPRIS